LIVTLFAKMHNRWLQSTCIALCAVSIRVLSAETGLLAFVRPRVKARRHLISTLWNLKGGETSARINNTASDSALEIVEHELVQVQIIHRHGDRTPVTPLHNRSFWENTLPQKIVLEKLAEDIQLVRLSDQGEGYSHGAAGGSPYGQLTTLGLLQMMELGTRLREELCHTVDGQLVENGSKKLFTPDKPLHPDRIKVRSTDFPRTIQSVQALLVGLFPDGLHVYQQQPQTSISLEIDVRHTRYHIPDPNPRNTPQQEFFERELALSNHMHEREREMKPLAQRVTHELLRQNIVLDPKIALQVASGFKVGEAQDHSPDNVNTESLNEGAQETTITPLPWGQLAEITKCLQVRDLLTVCSQEEQDLIMSHASWRWFETLRHPRICLLAMTPMITDIVNNALEIVDHYSNNNNLDQHTKPLLHIYSGHDSTLIGLMCAFQLETPSTWPPYGSYLKIELLRSPNTGLNNVEPQQPNYFVRFSLNGKILRSNIYKDEDTGGPAEYVPLVVLEDFLHQAHLDTEEHLIEHLKLFTSVEKQ